MIISLIKKLIRFFAGRMKLQKFFETLNTISLLGMNIGGGSDPKTSGEIFTLNYIRHRLKYLDKICLFDVGANIGNYTILLKKIFGARAQIHSFEPSHKTYQKLQSNLGNMSGVNLYNFGLGNQDGQLTLFSNADESGLASVYKRKLDHFNIHLSQEEKIQMKTLDAFCAEQKITRINFLKLDVEGHEMQVLQGGQNMIKAGAIDFIQFEFGGCNIDSRTYFQDFFYRLKDDYKIYRIVKDGLYPLDQYQESYEQFSTTNFLAEKK